MVKKEVAKLTNLKLTEQQGGRTPEQMAEYVLFDQTSST